MAQQHQVAVDRDRARIASRLHLDRGAARSRNRRLNRGEVIRARQRRILDLQVAACTSVANTANVRPPTTAATSSNRFVKRCMRVHLLSTTGELLVHDGIRHMRDTTLVLSAVRRCSERSRGLQGCGRVVMAVEGSSGPRIALRGKPNAIPPELPIASQGRCHLGLPGSARRHRASGQKVHMTQGPGPRERPAQVGRDGTRQPVPFAAPAGRGVHRTTRRAV